MADRYFTSLGPNIVRRTCAALLIAMLAASGQSAPAQEAALVRVGYVPLGTGNTIFFIADRMGFFRSEGLEVDLLPFDSSIKQVAPLAAGDLDVGGSSPSATLYNAIGRGNGMRIVADLGRDPPGYGFESLVVRREVIQSGRFMTLKDLKGLKVALSATGVAYWATLLALLRTAGLSYRDIDPVILSFPDYLAALRSGVVDAALVPEPAATLIARSGVATRINRDDSFYPNQQIVVVIYSAKFLKRPGGAGLKFMRAILRAARFYNDALVGGKFAGPNADAVVHMIADATPIKDPEVIRASVPSGTDPNGELNLTSMKQDLQTFQQAGLIQVPVRIETTVDLSVARAAVRQLGAYVPSKDGPPSR
jgi:NitT/TauT family transport system substrate-binding protein